MGYAELSRLESRDIYLDRRVRESFTDMDSEIMGNALVEARRSKDPSVKDYAKELPELYRECPPCAFKDALREILEDFFKESALQELNDSQRDYERMCGEDIP